MHVLFYFSGQFAAVNEELERRRDECIQLKSVLASRAKDSIELSKQSYGGQADILNEVRWKFTSFFVLLIFCQYSSKLMRK